MCPKFIASPNFNNGKWPTIVTKSYFVELYLTFFSKYQLIIKVNNVFYRFIKFLTRKNNIFHKIFD